MKGKAIMKNQNTICIAVVLALAFALAPVTRAKPTPQGGPTKEAASEQPTPQGGPAPAATAANQQPSSEVICVDYCPSVISIHSTGNVLRGKTGSFVLEMSHPRTFATYVNFKVSGTAVAGADYIALISPAYIGPSGYGTILVHTLPDLRGSVNAQAYSVVVTLEPGPGYLLGSSATGGQPSATIWIKP
jgi:hypothetical protein